MARRRTTKLPVETIQRLFRDDRLNLAPEFQRNSVWPRRAKAYLIDTILADRPISIFFLERHPSAQTGKSTLSVIDGQQRLRAILEFLEDSFRLSESGGQPWEGLRFSELSPDDQYRLLEYDLTVEELDGYTKQEVVDVFVRLNRFVVSLAPQELRHAQGEGAFHDFVERLGGWSFWANNRVFSANQIARMRPVEFAAELTILLVEGPQDKKRAVDLYYQFFTDSFPEGAFVEERLERYFAWLESSLDLRQSRFRRPVELYALVGALDRVVGRRSSADFPDAQQAGRLLEDFEALTREDDPPREIARYLVASSRQTDNLAPRLTRIEVLERLLAAA